MEGIVRKCLADCQRLVSGVLHLWWVRYTLGCISAGHDVGYTLCRSRNWPQIFILIEIATADPNLSLKGKITRIS